MINDNIRKNRKSRLEQEMKLCVIFTKICLKLYFLIYKKVKQNDDNLRMNKKISKIKLFETRQKMKTTFLMIIFNLDPLSSPKPSKRNLNT